MRKSEIFESFVKIAQERGLVSQAEHAEHTEKSFSETNPRMDSLTIEQISKLYNTKPPAPKEMEYKRNIIENAHPESVVISPSYDKLNGLVENENEGQAIRARIVMKDPDGHLTNRKYAKKDLLLSLVRVANELDARDNDELRKLADVCLAQSSGQMQKKAYAVPVIAAIAVVLGAVYAKQHLRFHSDGWARDYEKAIAEIDDLLNSNTNWGVGYAYTPQFIQVVTQLKTELSKLNDVITKAIPIIEKMETPRNAEELKAMANTPATQEAVQALQAFQEQMKNSYPFINSVINNFGNEGFKQRAIAQKGFLSNLVDSTEVLHGGAGLVADDFDDVKHALQTLKVDMTNLAKTLQGAESVKQKAEQDLASSQSEVASTFSQPQQQPGAPSSPEQPKAPGQDAEEEASNLFGKLF